jgi:hypothetical protein
MRCKHAGNYHICKFYDRGYERNSITVRRHSTLVTDGEAFQFWFDNPHDAARTYRKLHGVTDLELLLHRTEPQDSGIEVERQDPE